VLAVLSEDRRVNISRLSVATGMTRKEVSALLNYSRDARRGTIRRSGEQRALRVLRGWLTDPRFQNRDGRPDDLPYRGHKKSFDALVKLYGGDVTPKSVLRELERINAVKLTRTGTLRVRAHKKRNNIETHYQISELARFFEDFAHAVGRPSSVSEAPPFFGFKDSTVPSAGDAASFARTFSRRAAALLEDFQQWSAGREGSKSASARNNKDVRVGIGVYLLGSHQPPVTNSAGSTVNRPGTRPAQRNRR
jgi:uncharacterized protein DUF6502